MLRSLVWSGSSVVSMLLASVRTMPGIHERSRATSPPSLRSVKVRLYFNIRSAASCVVVIQVLPMMIGKRTSTTGPNAGSRSSLAAGSRRKSWLVKSNCTVMAGNFALAVCHQQGIEHLDPWYAPCLFGAIFEGEVPARNLSKPQLRSSSHGSDQRQKDQDYSERRDVPYKRAQHKNPCGIQGEIDDATPKIQLPPPLGHPIVRGRNMRYQDGCSKQWKRFGEILQCPRQSARHSGQRWHSLIARTRRPNIAALQTCCMRGQYDLYQPEGDTESKHLEFKCHCCPMTMRGVGS